MKVLVSHPSRQHVRWLLSLLERQNMLAYFYTMLPDSRKVPTWAASLSKTLYELLCRNDLTEIPAHRIKVLWGPLALQRLVATSRLRWLRDLGEWFASSWFDWWVARNLVRLKPDLVIGYEMCCVRTFRAAERLGIPRLLDAAACHFKWVDDQTEYGFLNNRIKTWSLLRRRKLEELQRADRIICPSKLAQRTYLDQGVDREKIIINPYGYDPVIFHRQLAATKKGQDLTFIYVGQVARHKGVDLLLQAYEEVLQSYPQTKLRLVGPIVDKDIFVKENIEIIGRVDAVTLVQELSESDCLVLPSRNDSFGMVVIEAMAMGLPVIVSENAGAASYVRSGIDGWVIPSHNKVAIKLSMSKLINNRRHGASLPKDRNPELDNLTWNCYQSRTLKILTDILE